MAAASDSTWPAVHLLGAPRVQTRDTVLPLAPKDALLLALLALDGPQPRDQLAALLWPASAPAGARANLRQRILRLQALAGQPLLELQGSTLALQPTLPIDVAQLQALLQADADAARGELLGQLRFDDEDAAAQWLAAARGRVQTTRNQVLQQQVDALRESGGGARAMPWLQRLVGDNPADETHARQLMQWHHGRADRGAAAAVYAALRETLKREHGSTPDPQTRALAEWIAADNRAAAPRAAAIASAALLRPPRLIEREAPWAQLERVWAEGGIVVVRGDAGIGKTRLLGDFAEHVGLPLRLRAHEGDRGVPHALLARWVAAREDAARQLPAWARLDLATLHPALGDAAAAPAQPPSALRLSQALGLLARADTAVCIDDLQFADHASLHLLPTVLAGLRCCLLALRGPALPAPLQSWLAQLPQGVQLLNLAPWSVAGVQALLDDAELPLDAAEGGAARLWQHTGGHPMLVLATLRALQQAGTSSLPPTLPVPGEAAGFVAARLAALSQHARKIAQVAAFADEAFSADLAAEVMGVPLPALSDPWAELHAAGLMNDAAQLHGVVQAAARASLPEPLRVAMHAALARALVRRGTAPARLAAHWEAAREPAEAAACHEAAAAEAFRRSRRDEQRTHWREAARLWQQAGRGDAAFAAGCEEAEAALTAGNPSDCLALVDTWQPRAADPHQWARVLRLRAWALAYRREWAPALAVVQQAQAPIRTAAVPSWSSEMIGLQAIVAALLGQTVLAEQSLQQARALVIDPADWELQLNHLTRIGDALTYLQRLPEALAMLETCLDLAERPEARTQRLSLLGNCTLLLYRLGHHAAALRRSREALALAGAIDQLHGQVGGQVLMQTALLAAASGCYAEALDLADRSLAVLAPLQAPQVLAMAQNHLAWIWCCLGQPARALQLLRSAEAEINLQTRLRRWTLRGELHRLCGTAPAGPPPEDWAACDDPATLTQAELALARALPPEEAAPRLATLAARLAAAGQPAHALQARVLRLQPLAALQRDAAEREALALAQALQQTTPLAAYGPEVLLSLHAALPRGSAIARDTWAAAQRWVQQVAQEQVPEAFREGFLQRNRVNLVLAQPPRG